MPDNDVLVLLLVVPWGLIAGGAYQAWKMRKANKLLWARWWREVHAAHVRTGAPREDGCRVCDTIRAHDGVKGSR